MTCPSSPGSVWLQAKLAYAAADAIYRAVRKDEHASLNDISPVRQIPYHVAAERVITTLSKEQQG